MNLKKIIGLVSAMLALGSACAQPLVKQIAPPGDGGASEIGENAPVGPVDQMPVLDPRHDPAARVGQALIDDLEAAVWGITLGSEVWNLDLDRPVQAVDGTVHNGFNRAGLPFFVEFNSFTVRPPNAHGLSVGIWSGKVSWAGEYYCDGLYFHNGDVTTIVPLYSRVDQSAVQAVHHLFMDLAGFPNGPEAYLCGLDATAEFQLAQNRINMSACVNSTHISANAMFYVCTAVAVASCWWTFFAGCVGGVICQLTVLANRSAFRANVATESQRTGRCLCLESQFRANNPGIPLPAASCGTFVCPPFSPIAIPNFK